MMEVYAMFLACIIVAGTLCGTYITAEVCFKAERQQAEEEIKAIMKQVEEMLKTWEPKRIMIESIIDARELDVSSGEIYD